MNFKENEPEAEPEPQAEPEPEPEAEPEVESCLYDEEPVNNPDRF